MTSRFMRSCRGTTTFPAVIENDANAIAEYEYVSAAKRNQSRWWQ